jgi:phospholipid/cholesterol/gamma-HCH transport system substrate-binding protein
MNRNKNTELIVGATVLVSLIILIAGVLWLKEVNVSRQQVVYSVLFPNVSTLQLGDPVMVNGVQKGAVKRISLHHDSVLVLIAIDEGVRLTDSSTIRVQNVGIMGERAIGIDLSSRGKTCSPGRDAPHITGYFDTGIAEAMGMLGTILTDVETLLARVSTIVDATVGDPSFTAQFKSIVERLNSVTASADELVSRHTHTISRAVNNIETLTGDLKTLVADNRGTIDTSLHNVQEITEKVNLLMADVDSITGTLKTMSRSIEKGEGTMGKLLEDESMYSDLKTSIADLDSLARQIRDKGMKVRFRLW